MTTPATPAAADDHAPTPAPAPQRMRTRPATWLAWALWALALALTALGLWLLTLTQATDLGPRWGPRGFLALFALAFTTVGALIAAHRPANRIGWLCCWIGLGNAVQLLAEEYAIYALLVAPGALPGGAVMAWLQSWIWALIAIPIWTVLPLLFPHGRLPSRRWQPVAWLAGGSIAAAAVANALMPGPLDPFPHLRNPFGIEGAGDLLRGVWVVAVGVMVVTAVAGMVAVLRRLGRARGAERQQLKWFAYATALVVVGWWPSR